MNYSRRGNHGHGYHRPRIHGRDRSDLPIGPTEPVEQYQTAYGHPRSGQLSFPRGRGRGHDRGRGRGRGRGRSHRGYQAYQEGNRDIFIPHEDRWTVRSLDELVLKTPDDLVYHL